MSATNHTQTVRAHKEKNMKSLFSIVIIVTFSIISSRSSGQVNSNNISKDSLIEDTRQLVKMLEECHPDPYLNFGGKIAFNRDFQGILLSIPEIGLNSGEFYKLLMPFVAKVADMHTGLISPVEPTQNGPGIPLKLKIIEQNLIVTGVPSEEYKGLLGSQLVSVGGLGIDELLFRQTRLRGVENKYGELVFLSISLKSSNGIKNLIPDWDFSDNIQIELKLVSGKMSEVNIQRTLLDSETQLTFPTKQLKPSTAKSDVVYDFLDDEKENVLLVISSMERYREASEEWFAQGMEGAVEYTGIAYQHFNNAEPPSDREKLLKGIPSATETFTSLIRDIKKLKTKNLIVDLRNNTGGSSVMKEMLIYFLFGKDGLKSMNQGFQIIKYSDLYFNSYSSDSLPLINSERELMLVNNDYDFSQEKMFRENTSGFQQVEEVLQLSPTFWNVYKTNKYDFPTVQLENILVLCNPFTTSSGFNMLTALTEKGAKVLGTASAQPGNNFGDILFFQLNNSGLKGYVSFKQNVTFPDNPEKGKCLMPDYPLTYQKFESFGFDPNAEIQYALEVLKISTKE